MRSYLIQLLSSIRSRIPYPRTVIYVVLGTIVLFSAQSLIVGQVTKLINDPAFHSTEDADALAEHEAVAHEVTDRIRYLLWVAAIGGFLSVTVMVALFERANKQRAHAAAVSEKALAALRKSRAEELGRIQAERARILESVSHELNTPITSVLAFSSILEKNRDRKLSERDLKHIAALKRNAEHLAFLIKDLINFSEVDDKRSQLCYDHVNLAELAEKLVESIEPIANARGHTLRFVADEPVDWVYIDRRRMNQMLMSLLNNAINYSPNDSTIEVDVTNTVDGVAISVTDNGPGIEPHEQEFVWQPFYRSDNEWTRAQSGSGLGLSLVKKIVDMHGGSVSLSSTPGEGTTVRVVLPRSSSVTGAHELSMPA